MKYIGPYLAECGLDYDIWDEALANYLKPEKRLGKEEEDEEELSEVKQELNKKGRFQKQTELEKLIGSSNICSRSAAK